MKILRSHASRHGLLAGGLLLAAIVSISCSKGPRSSSHVDVQPVQVGRVSLLPGETPEVSDRPPPWLTDDPRFRETNGSAGGFGAHDLGGIRFYSWRDVELWPGGHSVDQADSVPLMARLLICSEKAVEVTESSFGLFLDPNRSDAIWFDTDAIRGVYLDTCELTTIGEMLTVLLFLRTLPDARPLEFTVLAPADAEFPLRMTFSFGDRQEAGKFYSTVLRRADPDSIVVTIPTKYRVELPPLSDVAAWGSQAGLVRRVTRGTKRPSSFGDPVIGVPVSDRVCVTFERQRSVGDAGEPVAFLRWRHDLEAVDDGRFRQAGEARRSFWPVIRFVGGLPEGTRPAGRLSVHAIPSEAGSSIDDWVEVGTIDAAALPSGRVVPVPNHGVSELDPIEAEGVGIRVAGSYTGLQGRVSGNEVVIALSGQAHLQGVSVVSQLDHLPLEGVEVVPPAMGGISCDAGSLGLLFFQEGALGRKHWPDKPITLRRPGFLDLSFDPDTTAVVAMSPMPSRRVVRLWAGPEVAGVPLEDSLIVDFLEPEGGWGDVSPVATLRHGDVVDLPGTLSGTLRLTEALSGRFLFQSVQGEEAESDSAFFSWPLSLEDQDADGVFSVVMAGRPAEVIIPYRFEFPGPGLPLPDLTVWPENAGPSDRQLVTEYIDMTESGGVLSVSGLTYADTRITVEMPATDRFARISAKQIDLVPGEAGVLEPCGNDAVLVMARRPATVLLVDVTHALLDVWPTVIEALEALTLDEALASHDIMIAFGRDDMSYTSMRLEPSTAPSLKDPNLAEAHYTRPHYVNYHMQSAARELASMTEGIAGSRDRIVLVIGSSPGLRRPWSPALQPYDPDKVDLYVVEVCVNDESPPYSEEFFSSLPATEYTYVSGPLQVYQAMSQFTGRLQP